MTRAAYIVALVGALAPSAYAAAQLQDVVQSYALTESYNFAFPSKDAGKGAGSKYITDKWALNGDMIDFGADDIQFVADPASAGAKRSVVEAAASAQTSSPSLEDRAKSSDSESSSKSGSSSNSSTVLQIEYPQGSYSKQTGGTQFYAQPFNASSNTPDILPNSSSNGHFERMLLAYDIYFPDSYDFNKGGKLPGLRGGKDPHGCSGGHQTDGTECFSTRLMWRDNGLGEVYAYLPTTAKNFCKEKDITCNSDYGTSIARGSYSFAKGKWQTIWLYVALNKAEIRNGVVALFYNGVKAFELDNLELRHTESIDSIGGLYFSTFFGGDDESWASPADQMTYYRNIQLFGGLGPANGTGSKISGASTVAAPSRGLLGLSVAAAALVAAIAL